MASRQRELAKEKYWREVIGRQRASGLSATAFCRLRLRCEAIVERYAYTLYVEVTLLEAGFTEESGDAESDIDNVYLHTGIERDSETGV